MAHPGSHGKKAVKWTCACVLYRRVSRDDATTAAADSSSSAAGPDDDGDMTASTDSEVPKLDLAFKEGETIKTYIISRYLQVLYLLGKLRTLTMKQLTGML